MKANAPKRKVFNDAIDLFSEDPVVGNGIQMIPVEKIVPFHQHPFRMYEGERLDDMVSSIKEHGVLIPVIVQKMDKGYEMLAGHNRWNASKIVGIEEIPAIVKEDLTEEEEYIYVIETNLMQRSFAELLPSEKAAVLALRYEKIKCQGKRKDIIEEIAKLSGIEVNDTSGHDVHRCKSRDTIGEEYGMTGRNIARYARLHQTIEPIKEMVDNGAMTMGVAVELSYLSEDEQNLVAEVMDSGMKIKGTEALELRKLAGELSEEKVKEVLKEKEKPVSDVKIFAMIKKKYFKGKTSEEVVDILENALMAWFEREVDANV